MICSETTGDHINESEAVVTSVIKFIAAHGTNKWLKCVFLCAKKERDIGSSSLVVTEMAVMI
jgi:hypothetical protein